VNLELAKVSKGGISEHVHKKLRRRKMVNFARLDEVRCRDEKIIGLEEGW